MYISVGVGIYTGPQLEPMDWNGWNAWNQSVPSNRFRYGTLLCASTLAAKKKKKQKSSINTHIYHRNIETYIWQKTMIFAPT